jgi:hypothetical protein
MYMYFSSGEKQMPFGRGRSLITSWSWSRAASVPGFCCRVINENGKREQEQHSREPLLVHGSVCSHNVIIGVIK